MEALEVNRAIGEMFNYRLVTAPSVASGYELMFYIEHNGERLKFRDSWLITEEIAWKAYSPNWAFDANEAIKLIAGNSRFTIQVLLTGYRVTVRGTDIDIERKSFAHALSEAWYQAMRLETV